MKLNHCIYLVVKSKTLRTIFSNLFIKDRIIYKVKGLYKNLNICKSQINNRNKLIKIKVFNNNIFTYLEMNLSLKTINKKLSIQDVLTWIFQIGEWEQINFTLKIFYSKEKIMQINQNK